VIGIPIEFLKQAGVIGALIRPARSSTAAADWIYAVTFHLSVAAGIARQHLALLAWPLLGRLLGGMGA
jgi:hypothetical protein